MLGLACGVLCSYRSFRVHDLRTAWDQTVYDCARKILRHLDALLWGRRERNLGTENRVRSIAREDAPHEQSSKGRLTRSCMSSSSNSLDETPVIMRRNTIFGNTYYLYRTDMNSTIFSSQTIRRSSSHLRVHPTPFSTLYAPQVLSQT